jgi:hypothetical protein
MARVNPDPYTEGHVFTPANRVTAVFDSMDEARRAEEALREAGFTEQEIDLFFGEDGVKKFDATGEQHGLAMRLLHRLERFLGDDFDLHEHTNEALRTGHVILAAFTEGKADRKVEAGQILRRRGAHDIYFWGNWTTERLG